MERDEQTTDWQINDEQEKVTVIVEADAIVQPSYKGKLAENDTMWALW